MSAESVVCSPAPHWSALAGGGATAGSLSALAAVSPVGLSGAELVDAIVASEKALSLLAGVQMRLLSALAVPFVAGDPMRLATRLARNRCINRDDPAQVELFVAEAASCLAGSEVAAALRISPVTGGIRVREAEAMTTDLAPTLAALEAGRLDRGKVRVIAEHCRPLTPGNAAAVQQLVLDAAQSLSTGELRDATAQAVIIVDPAGARDRHEQAAAGRALTLRAQPDAMATLTGFLPADGAVKIFQVSDLLATGAAGAAGDTRGIAARRIDALVDIADQLLTHGQLDLTHFLRPTPTGDHETGLPAGGTGHSDPGPHGPVSPDGCDADRGGTEPGGAEPGAGGSGAREPSNGRRRRVEPARGGAADRVLTRQGRRPHLSVTTIGLSTLAGLDQLPAVLAGFGAIPATLARAIATSAGTITAVITDPATGTANTAGS